MAKYKIVGYEHNSGTSKKTGKPYDMHILHVVSEKPMKGQGKLGCSAEQIAIGADDGILTQIPAPGEVWEFSFNRQGRVDDAYPAE